MSARIDSQSFALAPIDAVRVLLLEDSVDDAHYLQATLKPPSGVRFDIVHRKTLKSALALLDEEDIDVALVDLGLPDSRPPETVARIREAGHDLPIVVLSGISPSDASTVGAQEVIQKWDLEGAAVSRSLLYAVEQHRGAQLARRVALNHVDATLVVDEERTIRFANTSAASLLQAGDPADLIGNAFAYEFEPGTTREIELENVGIVEACCTKVPWDGGHAYLVSMRDISDRIRSEELRRRLAHTGRLAAMGQLAAGVAHELNNPISFVRSNTELCLDNLANVLKNDGSELSASSKEALDEVIDMLQDNLVGTTRMASIVNDLRLFSRIDRDEYEKVDLVALIESACTMVRAEIRHRAVLKKQLARVPSIVGDRAKLTQVVTNLLINAAQAIEVGARAENLVGVRLHHTSEAVEITISDSGCGVPKEHIDRIFDPFFTTKPRGVGTGLGLSLSMETVRQHGGTITVNSGELGSRFRITLPIDNGLELGKRPEPEAKGVTQKLRLLVVDDDAYMLKALRRRLVREQALHEVVAETNPEAALALLETERFDLVICDLMMPDIDGVQFYERAQEKRQTPPFVFVTGGAFSDRIRDFVDQSPVPVIEKPIDFEALLAAIGAQLHTKSAP